MPTIQEALTEFRKLQSEGRSKRAQQQSQFYHVNWDKAHGVWQVHVSIHGKLMFISRYPHNEEQFAARDADIARWHLQDFITRKPKYNFPNELPPLGEPNERIQSIRANLIRAGVPRNKPHDERFVPFTKDQEPSTTVRDDGHKVDCDIRLSPHDVCSCGLECPHCGSTDKPHTCAQDGHGG